jgi:hypothetical protein
MKITVRDGGWRRFVCHKCQMTTSSRLYVLRRFTSGIWLTLGLLLTLLRLSADVSITTESPGNPVLPRQYAPGSSVKFIVVVPDPTATYQWFHDGVAIAGATATSLLLTNLSSADSGNYQLKATAGSAVSLSNTVTVNVLPLPPSPVDLTFSSQLPASAYYPPVLLVAPDGASLVQNYEGVTNPPLIRLLPDGRVDPLFHFPITAGFVLAGLPGGGLITTAAPYRLNPDGSPHALILPAGFDSTKSLTAAAVQSDGKLLIAQGNAIARLNSDDSLDPTFAYSTTLSPQHIVTGLKLDATGRIYATATERDPVTSHYPSSWTVLYRLAATGAESTGFSRQEPPLRRGGIAVYPLADGRLLRYSNYEGIVYWAMLANDGSVDPSWSPASSAYASIPVSIAVDPVGERIFTLDYRGIRRALITATSLVDDPGFYPGGGQASFLQLTPSGQLLVSGSFTQWDGHASSRLIRLRTTDVTAVPPVANIGPGDVAPLKGSTQTFTSTVTGAGPFSYQWLALDGQPLPANTTSPTLAIASFDTVNFGRYQLRITWATGTVLSNVTRAIYNPSQLPYLANLSGRAFVGTGDDTAIAGLAVKINAGALGVTTLLRGAGPALQPYGVTGFLPNPVLNLYNATGQLLANNDTWGGTSALTSAASTTGAFPFDSASHDAALLNTFYTGNTTLQLLDQAGGSGVGLLEIYRVPNPIVAEEITNLSLRARTGPGEKVAIAGFVIVDPQGFGRSARVLLRVVGPTLSQYGVAFPLADPVLTLYDAQGQVVARNDNWSDTDPTGLAAAMQQVGAFSLPTASKDAAVLLDLPAGVYSVQATGIGTSVGITLIEIYLVR